jgi:hypothetical protein
VQGRHLDALEDGPYRSQAAFDAIAARCSAAQVGSENETKDLAASMGLSIGFALGPWQAVGDIAAVAPPHL